MNKFITIALYYLALGFLMVICHSVYVLVTPPHVTVTHLEVVKK